jgi:hypothetical protein
MSESSDSDASHRQSLCPHPWRAAPSGAASGPANNLANLRDSFEQFLLEKGEKKVEMKLDTRGS